ncbi:MAG: PilN domain-containing protein [Desulfobacterota bacterium]|nr:PilN domain-containing protein [Thermodesulfobacteriota bacterium]
MIKINLLPYRTERKKELILQQIIIGIVPIVVALIVVSGFWVSISTEIATAERNIAAVKKDIEQAKVKLKEIDDFKKNKELLTKKMDVIAKLQKGKSGPVHLIEELATCLPGGLWLTSVKQTGMNLEIAGKALDNIAISNYMINLEGSPYFDAVDLKQIKTDKQKSSKGGGYIKLFTLTCNVVYEIDAKQKTSS